MFIWLYLLMIKGDNSGQVRVDISRGGRDMTKWKLRGQYMTLKEGVNVAVFREAFMQQPLFYNISILGGGGV